jgi:hypothetical protein
MAPYQEELQAMRESQGFVERGPAAIEKYYQILFRTYFYDSTKVSQLNFRMSGKAFVNGEKVAEILCGTYLQNHILFTIN